MENIYAVGYTESQILTRKSVFSNLTGVHSFKPILDIQEFLSLNQKVEYVILNGEINPWELTQFFIELKALGIMVLIFSDKQVNSFMLSFFLSSDNVYVLYCLENFEIEQVRNALKNKSTSFKSIASVKVKKTFTPIPGFDFEKLNEKHQRIFCHLIMGTPIKTIAAELNISESTVNVTINRMKQKFGNVQTSNEIINALTLWN
ncbi:MAG: sigma-70 family RNA polymerase sigma factor [Spirochaetaceae bacterium]|nr:sigma-70 family RNA polymerase sigma factor [Spirochaetaceae bacterium]